MFEEYVLKRTEILGLEINRGSLRRVFEQHINGERNYAWGLWQLLSLSLWINRYYKHKEV